MQKVLCIGKSGQLASQLAETVPTGYEIKCLGRNDVDITDKKAFLAMLEKENADAIVNASAYTAVDDAEDNREDAFAINADAVRTLAEFSEKTNTRFIHVSTDYVFNGQSCCQYSVDDATDAINAYGESKLAGELAILEHAGTIIRTSWLYAYKGQNFALTMLRLMKEKPQLTVVDDQIGAPTSARGLAGFIWAGIAKEKLDKVYHWRDLGTASWYDFAVAIQEVAFELGLLDNCIPIVPVDSSAFVRPAKRPQFSLLDVTTSEGFCEMKHWRKRLYEELSLLVSH